MKHVEEYITERWRRIRLEFRVEVQTSVPCVPPSQQRPGHRPLLVHLWSSGPAPIGVPDPPDAVTHTQYLIASVVATPSCSAAAALGRVLFGGMLQYLIATLVATRSCPCCVGGGSRCCSGRCSSTATGWARSWRTACTIPPPCHSTTSASRCCRCSSPPPPRSLHRCHCARSWSSPSLCSRVLGSAGCECDSGIVMCDDTWYFWILLSVRYSDRRAVQAIGRIDRGADQNEGLKGTLLTRWSFTIYELASHSRCGRLAGGARLDIRGWLWCPHTRRPPDRARAQGVAPLLVPPALLHHAHRCVTPQEVSAALTAR